MKNQIRTTTFAIALATATYAVAHDGVKNPAVIARMDAMETISSNVKTIGEMAQGKIAFDAPAAQAALDAITMQAGLVPNLFEANETDPKSKASPTIWKNWENFTTKAAAVKTVSENADVSTIIGLGQAMNDFGGTCRACHMSYKN